MATVNRLKKKKQNEFIKDNNNQKSINEPVQQGRIFKSTPQQHTQEQQSQYQQYYSLSQCNPIGVQPTSTLYPNNQSLSRHYNFPMGLSFSPLISLQNENCEFAQKTGDQIQRCGGCRAYMNCYNTIDKKKFNCFLCGRQNMLQRKMNEEQNDQIVMNSSIYQSLSPQNFYATPATEDCFIFLIDLNPDSYQCRMIYYFVAAMKEVLANPQLDETYIYFYSYDQILQQYDFSGQQIKCTIMDKTINKTAIAQPQFLRDIREKLFELLDSLEQISQNNTRKGSNLKDAFEYIFPLAMQNRAKVFIVQSNQALSGEVAFHENTSKNKEQQNPPKSILQTKNNVFMQKYVVKMLQNGISISFYCFARNFKNLRVWSDVLKLTSSQIMYYTKDSNPDLQKFYYDLSYSLGATYFKQVKTEFIISHGYCFSAIYGNFYRIKQSISFLTTYIDPSKKIFCLFNPHQKAQNQLPYVSMQVNINYRYKRQDYMTVFTVVYPVTGYIDRLISSMDIQMTQAILHKSYMSALRMEKIQDVRKKVFDAGAGAWVTLLELYKKKDKIPAEYMCIFSSILAMMKSYHIQLEGINNTPILDKVVGQRNNFQFCGPHQISNYFNPYLFDLVNMDESVCRQDQQFVYPPALQPRFSNVKQGLFLLDNGIALYIFIAKKCPPQILNQVFGKPKLSKNQVLLQQNIIQTQSFRSSQIQVLIRTLREQRATGWSPLYIVRCGQNSNNERNFYLNFYIERYEQFRSYKISLQEFIATLSKSSQ